MGHDLNPINDAHEQLKWIMHLARSLYMRSLNATLQARQTGAEAAGFRAVTLELQKFSNQINGEGGALQGHLQGLVYEGAERQRRLRWLERLEQGAQGASPPSNHEAFRQAKGVRERLAALDAETLSSIKDARRALVRIGRLLENGRYLGVLLRSEAAGIEALSTAMGDEVITLLEGLSERLDQLGQELDLFSREFS